MPLSVRVAGLDTAHYEAMAVPTAFPNANLWEAWTGDYEAAGMIWGQVGVACVGAIALPMRRDKRFQTKYGVDSVDFGNEGRHMRILECQGVWSSAPFRELPLRKLRP